MPQYCISDLYFAIDTDWSPVLQRLRLFQCQPQPGINMDMSIAFRSADNIEEPAGKVISDTIITWVQKNNLSGGHVLYSRVGDNKSPIITMAEVDEEWRNGTISCMDPTGRAPQDLWEGQKAAHAHAMMGIMFRNNLLFHGGLVMHASTIRYQGKGIMFTAPSGTGKSTQAKLWQQVFGPQAEILNDDTPAIRFRHGYPWVFGTPWCGSSDIHCNGSAPLSLIVILQQADTNRLYQLNSAEAAIRLMPRVFMPSFSRPMMEIACSIFEIIINTVPVILLKCRPDQEAVRLVHDYINQAVDQYCVT